MLTYAARDATVDLLGADPEALIREARQRTRRRRWRRGALAVLVGAGAALAYAAAAGGGTGIVRETAGTPFVNVKAFSDRGDLAFISRGSLWLLDGEAGSVRKVASTSYTTHAEGNVDFGGVPAGTALIPSSPTFSHDGKWLAYLVPHATGDSAFSQLWIAHGDGAGAHPVRGLAVAGAVGWSPTADTFAVITDTRTAPIYDPATHTRMRFDESTVLALVTPTGITRRLLALSATSRGPSIYDAVWSPTGNAVAVATFEGFPSPLSTIRSYPVTGGAPTTWLVLRARRGLAGVCGAVCQGVTPDLAGWWQGWGILFWALPGSLAQTDNATALLALASPAGTPRLIAHTLASGTLDEEIAPGPDGALALVATTGETGREYTSGKSVETCALATRTCTPLPGDTTWSGTVPSFPCANPCSQFHLPPSGTPGSAVTLDPTWSPDGSQLAYVEAPATPTAENPTPAWFAAHELFVWSAATGASHKLAGTRGAMVPAWSSDGTRMLYVANDGLWLVPRSGGPPVEIEHPLFPESEWRAVATNQLAFYGQIPWTAHFSWWSRGA